MTNSNYVIELFIKHCNRDVKHTFENLGYLGNPKMILMFKQMFTEELSVCILIKLIFTTVNSFISHNYKV